MADTSSCPTCGRQKLHNIYDAIRLGDDSKLQPAPRCVGKTNVMLIIFIIESAFSGNPNAIFKMSNPSVYIKMKKSEIQTMIKEYKHIHPITYGYCNGEHSESILKYRQTH